MEDDTKNGVLNLDEMLGEKKLTVRIQGKDFSIRTIKSLSPEEFSLVKQYSVKFSNITEEDLWLDDGVVVAKAVDDMLELLAPTLPKPKFSFMQLFQRGYKRRFAVSLKEAAAIFKFWSDNSISKNALRAVKPKTKKKVS